MATKRTITVQLNKAEIVGLRVAQQQVSQANAALNELLISVGLEANTDYSIADDGTVTPAGG